ncbi:MAG: ATP phosphoribosyltransferase [Phototrophicaceae bacterium]
MNEPITLALPSKGAIAEPTNNFLAQCGLRIHKPNPRQYTGSIPALPGVNVLFQRVKDVMYKVADGTAQIGITGYDVVREHPHDDLIVIHPELGYGHCELTVAVPEAWVDVETMADLHDIALDFRESKQRNLRVATTYTNLTRQFLHASGIHHFTMVRAEGAIEVAPTIGYADVIVDLTQTGTTLRENHLKMLHDGQIITSQACLIGNRPALEANPALLDTVRVMLERIDAALNGKRYSQLTANIEGDSAENIAQRLMGNPITRGLLGPTISPVYGAQANGGGRWHTVTLTVNSRQLLDAVEHLRTIGSTQIVVQPVEYVFLDHSPTFARLSEQLQELAKNPKSM